MWICVLIVSSIMIIVLFVYTLNDYMESPTVINIGTTVAGKSHAFPAVSVCIRKYRNHEASIVRVKDFVEKYHAEHNITMRLQ